MRGIYYLVICVLSIVAVIIIPSLLKAEEKGNKIKVLDEQKRDLNRDGTEEQIILKGEKISSDSSYYQKVWAEITNEFGLEKVIHYQGGYEPQIELLPLTDSTHKNIYYKVRASSDKPIYHYQIHLLQNQNLIKIPLPKHNHLTGVYKDHFKIEIFPTGTKENPKVIDIEHLAKEYIIAGIYDTKGQLQKPKTARIKNLIRLEPFLVNINDQQHTLKSYQKIQGISPEEEVATIELLWHYENNQWRLKSTKLAF